MCLTAHAVHAWRQQTRAKEARYKKQQREPASPSAGLRPQQLT